MIDQDGFETVHVTKARHVFIGTTTQLINALTHMANERPISQVEKAVVREAVDVIGDQLETITRAREVMQDALNQARLDKGGAHLLEAYLKEGK